MMVPKMIILSDMIDDKHELSKFELIYNTYKSFFYIKGF